MNTQTSFSSELTGESPAVNYRLINYKFGDYNINIQINEKNEFVGIENISVDKIFYDYKSVNTSYDVSDYYKD